MSIIEYKHSYLNIIVAVFCAKIVVDFGFESVIIDCLYREFVIGSLLGFL